MNFDRPGSTILEELIASASSHVPNQPLVGLPEVLAMASWYLWWIRRSMIHGKHTPSVGNWKLSILAMCNSFAKPRPNASIMENIKCSKPDVGHLKLNVDASFQSEGGAGSTCAMICIHTTASLQRHVLSFLMLLMHRRWKLAHERGTFVGGIDGISSNYCGTWLYWSGRSLYRIIYMVVDWRCVVYADCVELVTKIGDVQFKHCVREANIVAHEVVKHC